MYLERLGYLINEPKRLFKQGSGDFRATLIKKIRVAVPVPFFVSTYLIMFNM